MKKQILALLAVIIVLAVFSAKACIAYQQTFLTVKSSGFVQQATPPPPLGKYSYIMSVSGSNYHMIDGATGQLVFQSASSSQVFSNVVGNCSVGSSVYVESGLYVVNTMWTMLDVNNVTLNFEAGAQLIAGNGLDTSVLMIGEPYYPSNNITVNGITINGNAANQVITYSNSWNEGEVVQYPNGLGVSGSNDKIIDAKITNCRVMGVSFFWTASGGQFTYETNDGITNSQIYNCGWNGITFYGSPVSTNFYLTDSTIWGCSDVGVSLTGGVNISVSGNYVYDMSGTTGSENSEVAIAIEGGGDDTITNNTIYDSCIGISNSGWSNNLIANNTISVSSSYYVSYGSGGSLSSNNPVIYHETWGIVSSGCNDLISDNTVTGMLANATSGYYNTGGDGLWLAGEKSSYISNNTISQCQGYAVYANSGQGVSIGNILTENTIFDDIYGIYDNNVPENTFIANTGYNPVGSISNPISGGTTYLVDSGSNSVWTSGMTYTNSGSPKTLDITGGAVSAVTQNGVTLFTATDCSVTLQPGDTFSVTFSIEPTINVIGD